MAPPSTPTPPSAPTSPALGCWSSPPQNWSPRGPPCHHPRLRFRRTKRTTQVLSLWPEDTPACPLPGGRRVRAAGLLSLGSRSNGGRLHSQLLPPLALLVFYRPVSMLQTSKYSTTFLGREYRFPVPHQNMDLPPASGTPLGHPLSFRGPGSRLSLQTLSLISLFSVLMARMWEGPGH